MTRVITLTDSALAGGNAMSVLAGRLASTMGTGQGAGHAIVILGSSAGEQAVVQQRSAALCTTGDILCRSNLMTLPARENAQKLVGLLGLVGVDAALLDPAVYAPITRGHALEAEPRLLHGRRYEEAASRTRVLVLAGGVGRTPEGAITSLGTGGAELSGLFIAQRLGLRATLVVSPREIEAGYEVPRRAALFARNHAMAYTVGSEIVSREGAGVAISA
jgi:hypothetical protein